MGYQLTELQFLLAQGEKDVPEEKPVIHEQTNTPVPTHTFDIPLFPEDLAVVV